MSAGKSGPLAGFRIIENGGKGPAPLAGMVLADLGAEVIRVDRFAGDRGAELLLARGKQSICVDLKKPDGAEVLLRLVETADGIVEGFRPGVAERMGIGPDRCLQRNPKIVYGRMTGWGQEGPLAAAAGHDINYIALTGALDAIGREGDAPLPPLNLVGDYGGGAMFLVVGMLSGILEAQRSGRGQVVDAAMIDGASILLGFIFGLVARGEWGPRGTNLLDTGSHFYNVYETRDGQYLAVGAIEPQFYAQLLEGLGIAPEDLGPQREPATWPGAKELLAARFKSRTREEWLAVFEGTDACVTPVLSIPEALEDEHHRARISHVTIDGIPQPAPAPRFSRTTPQTPHAPVPLGSDTDSVLSSLGLDVAALRASGAVQ